MIENELLGIENGPEDVLKHFQLWRFLRKRSDGDVVKDGIGFLFGVDPKEEVVAWTFAPPGRYLEVLQDLVCILFSSLSAKASSD